MCQWSNAQRLSIDAPNRWTDHAHYWVYRERIVGAGDDAEPRWFLHGLFG